MKIKIEITGPRGVGKTTVAKEVVDILNDSGYKNVRCEEFVDPTDGSRYGEVITGEIRQ